jgi:heat shock protein HslJ
MHLTSPGFVTRSTLSAALAACLSLAGCAGMPEQPQKSTAGAGASATANRPLSDTAWRLVEIQSMDSAVGTKRPDDRNKYTMQLRSDGTVAMKLDCNRASGTWTAEPSSDGISGRFGFGPLAGTRALCPPPSLDERITGQAPSVRGYLLKNGRLHLTLMADGGIVVWEPADIEVPFAVTPDAAIEAAVLAATPSFTKRVIAAGGPDNATRYVHGRVDLNGDGRAEVLVFLMGGYFCGTGGCNLMVFSEDAGRLTLIADFVRSRPPLIVSPKRTRGWSDLFRLESGGGAPPVYVRHVFDGKTYVEAERVRVGEVPPEGRWHLAGELGPKVGAPLMPRE